MQTLNPPLSLTPCNQCIVASDKETEEVIRGSFFVYRNFINEEEEMSLFNEVEPYLKRLHYEQDHWDDVGSCL
jgi:alkylated DNA repair protein alkB family protein 7